MPIEVLAGEGVQAGKTGPNDIWLPRWDSNLQLLELARAAGMLVIGYA